MSELTLDENQKLDRSSYTDRILNSSAKLKLLVAGPGTGKTYTFTQVFKKIPGKKLAITFIRKLVNEMRAKFDESIEVRTFHEFCKWQLHKNSSDFNLEPFLPDIIKRDAALLSSELSDFTSKFQNLDEQGLEIQFYLKRSDYYNTVSFDDVVYRYLKLVQENPSILPKYQQIVIDEYQDFNKLETEFINLLEHSGNILVAGDDDQALYSGRFSSPSFIRQLYYAGRYECFELPYCSRCPEVIVNIVNDFIANATKEGYLKDRIKKNYKCYIPDKESDSRKHPRIVIAECSTISAVIKFIKSELNSIDSEDIADSYKPDSEYPTALIIGPRHYLEKIHSELSKDFCVDFTSSDTIRYSFTDAIRILVQNPQSNLGWRLVVEMLVSDEKIQSDIIQKSEESIKIIDCLQSDLVEDVLKIVSLTKDYQAGKWDATNFAEELNNLCPKHAMDLIKFFAIEDSTSSETPDVQKKRPSVLLTTYQGAKGLSGGHVFLLGVNNGILPKDPLQVTDVELAQFLVALTRTRKKFYSISNRWFIAPRMSNGKRSKTYMMSKFVDLIPTKYRDNLGYKRVQNIK
ncbi:MAG: UvrD/REP helicase family protein [uncultured bacterium]|nr:MAG: UvrD/REP helicase family protein [uncultured bacterium]